MADYSEHLRDDEKQSIEVGVSAVHRAHILAGVAQIADVFGAHDRAAELVSATRERLADVDPKRLKKLSKYITQTSVLLGELPDVKQKDEPSDAPVEVAPAVELSAQLIEAPEATESEDMHISNAGVRFLEKGLGQNWWQELGLESAGQATPEVIAAIMTRNVNLMSRTPAQAEAMLLDFFSGKPQTHIAESEGVSGPTVSLLFKRIRDDRKWQGLSSSTSTLRSTQMLSTKNASERSELDLSDVTHASLAAGWAQRLGLDDPARQQLEGLLDPMGRSLMLGKEVADVVRALVDYVTDRYGSIDNEELALTDLEKTVIRQITGAWYQATNGEYSNRNPTPLFTLLQKTRAARAETQTIAYVYGGLQRMLMDDTAPVQEVSPVAVEEEVEAVERPSEMVDGAALLALAIENSSHVSVSEWETFVRKYFINKAIGRFLEKADATTSHRMAEELWTRLTFDAEGAYRATLTDAQRSAFKVVQQRFFEHSERLADKPKQKMAVRVLCNMSSGVKSLDDVLAALQKKYPKVTQTMAQRYAVDGITELIR